MVFSSLLFLYLFLPLNLIFYRFAPSMRAKNIVMLVFSLIFYAWGEPIYILLLIGMTAADWLLSLYIERQEKRSVKAKLGVAAMSFVNLGLLAFFKYLAFILTNFRHFTGFPSEVPEIFLPIGISFYTFQLISYVVDVYRGEVPVQKRFSMLLLYVCMFHQCIAGPIVRYKDVCAELEERRATSADISDGVWRFSIGLAKKAVLANACGAVVNALLGKTVPQQAELLSGRPVIALWVGMLAFSLQIYLDFSAYSDMAIGMGRMIGIHYLENFMYPYLSRSVTEFWRRWHISLSNFFRDYLYIPLGGNRNGKLRNIFNLLIVWTLTGLWHGASWNYVLWGLYFFVFLIVERLFLLPLLKKRRGISHVYLLIVIYFGWILFFFRDISSVLTALKGMFGMNGNGFCDFETLAVIGSYGVLLLLSIIACTPFVKRCCSLFQTASIENRAVFCLYTAGRILTPVFLLLLSTVALAGDSYNPFLYFQF